MKIEIGKPCSPSKITSVKDRKVTKFVFESGRLTHTNYADSFTVSDRFYNLTLIDGNTKQINSKYVVSIQDKQAITVVTDTTQHTNYSEVKVKKSISTRIFVIDLQDSYTVHKDYMTSADKYIIDRKTEITDL